MASLQWFTALFVQHRTGDFAGSFLRSILLAVLVLGMTVVLSVMAGLAFRRRFVGATLVFYLAIASLIMPGLLVGLGIGLMCQLVGLPPAWYTSALGQLTWTLPFGLLIMFAVLSRFNRLYEEAARDLGASAWQTFAHVVLPILLPGIIAVALFGFTLSYDEFARTLLTVGPSNTLPLEIGDDHEHYFASALCPWDAHHGRVVCGDYRGADGACRDPAPPGPTASPHCGDQVTPREEKRGNDSL